MKLIMKRGGGGGFISDIGSAFDDAVHSAGSAIDDAVGEVPGGWGTVISAGTGGFGGDFLGSGFDAGFDAGGFEDFGSSWGDAGGFDVPEPSGQWVDDGAGNFDWQADSAPASEPPPEATRSWSPEPESTWEPQVDSYSAPADATPQDWGMPEDASWSEPWGEPPAQDPFEVDGQQASGNTGADASFNENADINLDKAGDSDLMKGLKGLANDKMFGGLAKAGLGLLGAKAARQVLNRGYSPKSGSSLLGGGPLGAPGRNLASGGGGGPGVGLGSGAGAGGAAGSVLGIGGRQIPGGAASLANVGRNLPVALGKIGAAHGMAQVPHGPLMMARKIRNGGV